MYKFASHLPLAGLLLVAQASLAAAGGVLTVDDDHVQCPSAGFSTIGAALAAAAPGDTITVCDGTYAEGTLVVDKAVVIDGVNRDSTFVNVTTTSTFGFHVRVSGVTISDLVIQEIGGAAVSSATGIRIEPSGASVDNTVISNVVIRDFLDGNPRGIDLSAGAINDLSVLSCTFTNNLYGIRMGSNSHVDGLVLTGSSFSAPANGGDFTRIGVYQANDGNSSTFRDLQASGNSFTNLSLAGIYVEELRDSTISANTFTNDYTGIIIDKRYAATAIPLSNVSMSSNHFVNSTGRAIFMSSLTLGLGANVAISGNDIDVSAAALLGPTNRGAITTNFQSTLTHQPLTISSNHFTFSGAFTTATAAWAVNLAGDGPVVLDRNTFSGGSIGGSATNPPTAAIYLQANSATLGLRQDPVTVTCNTLSGFVHGITVYDPVAGTPGDLPAGVAIGVHTNDIAGNSAFGVFNAMSPQTSATIDADSNYWGSPSGPSGQGPGTGDAISQFVSAASPLLGPQALCTTPVELLSFTVS